jgi:hypothetical protein
MPRSMTAVSDELICALTGFTFPARGRGRSPHRQDESIRLLDHLAEEAGQRIQGCLGAVAGICGETGNQFVGRMGDGGIQRVSVGEVAVQRGDAHAGLACDRVQRDGDAVAPQSPLGGIE